MTIESEFLSAELKAARAGDTEAEQLLLALVADHQAIGGNFGEDVSNWLTEYLRGHIENLSTHGK